MFNVLVCVFLTFIALAIVLVTFTMLLTITSETFRARVTPKRQTRIFATAFLTVMVALLGLVVVACTKQQAQTAVDIGVDLSGAVCTQLDENLQNEPIYVKFICSFLEGASATPAKSFTIKVKKPDAAKFATDHCVKVPATGGNPTP